MLLTQGSRVKDITAYWRIKFLHILQEVRGICKTRNQLRMILFLAALTRGLCSRVLGAAEPSFRPVMGKRGEAGAGVGSSSSGMTTAAASASETPRRWAMAVRDGAG